MGIKPVETVYGIKTHTIYHHMIQRHRRGPLCFFQHSNSCRYLRRYLFLCMLALCSSFRLRPLRFVFPTPFRLCVISADKCAAKVTAETLHNWRHELCSNVRSDGLKVRSKSSGLASVCLPSCVQKRCYFKCSLLAKTGPRIVSELESNGGPK